MTGILGQDWSNYQANEPDTTGLSYAFVKITQGTTYINPRWADQRNHAKANGLVWGGYHFANLNANPEKEADFFLRQVNWLPGDMIALDWEANNDVSSKQQVDSYKNTWLKYVKSKMPNNPVGLYCDKDFWTNYDTNGYAQDFLWIATLGLPMGQPGIKDPWQFHQYSTTGNIDHDYCPLPSTAALRAWALSYDKTTPTNSEPTLSDFTEAQLISIVQNAVTSQPVRDTLAMANMYWLLRAFDTTLPIPSAAENASLNAAVTGLRKQISSLPTEIQQGLKDSVFQVSVAVNGTVK